MTGQEFPRGLGPSPYIDSPPGVEVPSAHLNRDPHTNISSTSATAATTSTPLQPAQSSAQTPSSPVLATPLLTLLENTMSALAETTTKASEAIAKFRSTTPASSEPESATFQAVIAELQALGQSIASLTTAFQEKDINIKTYIDSANAELRAHIDSSIASLLTSLQTPGEDNWLANQIHEMTESLGNLTTRVVRIETAPEEDVLPEYPRQASSSASGSRRPTRN